MRRLLVGLAACALAALCVFTAIPASAAYETGGVIETKMSNGLTLLVLREPGASVVAIEVFVRVGAVDETERTAGMGQMLSGTILAGTESYGQTRLARMLAEVGGNFHAYWRWNYLEISALSTPQQVMETIRLLSDAVQESSIDPGAVEYARSAILRETKRQDADAFSVAYTTLKRAVHHGSEYDRAELGNPSAISKVSQAELKAFYRQNVSPDRMVICIVGDIDAADVGHRVEKSFGGMETHNAKRTKPRLTKDSVPATDPQEIAFQGSVTYEFLGYRAPGVESPDYPAMCVANVLLGGNKSSMLFTRLREEKGLGYQVGSLYPALTNESHVAAYLGMDSSRATPEVLSAVRETMVDCVKRMCEGGFSDDDLRRAKGYLIGRHAVKHERTRDRAYLLGWPEVVGLGYQHDFEYPDKIEAVTKADVVAVCARYLHEPSEVTLKGGKASATEAKAGD